MAAWESTHTPPQTRWKDKQMYVKESGIKRMLSFTALRNMAEEEQTVWDSGGTETSTGYSARRDQPDGLHSVVQSDLLTRSDLTLQLMWPHKFSTKEVLTFRFNIFQLAKRVFLKRRSVWGASNSRANTPLHPKKKEVLCFFYPLWIKWQWPPVIIVSFRLRS